MTKKNKIKLIGGVGALFITLENKELKGQARRSLKALRPMNLRYSYALRRMLADKRLINNLPPSEITEPVDVTPTV